MNIEVFYENAFLLGLITMRLILSMAGYYEIKNSGEILFKLRYKMMTILELVLVILMVTLFTVFNMYYLQRNFVSTILIVIYSIIVSVIHSRIIVTKKGFFYRGQYIEWENIIEISIVNTRTIKMKKIAMIAVGFKIRELENQKEFLEIAYNKAKLES